MNKKRECGARGQRSEEEIDQWNNTAQPGIITGGRAEQRAWAALSEVQG